MNIPIYRGLKLGTENEYVEGFYFNRKNMLGKIIYHKIDFSTTCDGCVAIDPSTLSIHFPDMLDSQGNKIFASLQEDGKGGDIMKDDEYYGIAKYKDSRFVVEYENVEECLYEGNFEAIGMQQWQKKIK